MLNRNHDLRDIDRRKEVEIGNERKKNDPPQKRPRQNQMVEIKKTKGVKREEKNETAGGEGTVMLIRSANVK